LQLLVILSAGIILRLMVLLNSAAIEIDGMAYAAIADDFLKGLFAQGLTNVFSPMYPASVALFHLLIPDVELAGRLVSLTCGTLLIYVGFLFARRFFNDARKAMWVAFLVAFQPYMIRSSGQVLSESFTTLVFTLSVFAFYVGWRENRRTMIGLSGFCLVLSFLARPEYLVYFAPFVLFLLSKRRVTDIGILLLPLCVLGFAYVFYLHLQTGLWLVSKKATLSPIVPASSFFTNLPFVAYHFGSAIFPPFLLLAAIGFVRTEGKYRSLLIVLILFHILSLSFISHSTKRYSVEFIPVCMLVAAEGVPLVFNYLRRFSPKYLGACLVAAAIMLPGILQSCTPARYDRKIQKEAGRYLGAVDPGSVIAARLPIVAFYAHGKTVELSSELEKGSTIGRLDRLITDNHAKYLVVEGEMESDLPFLEDYVSGLSLLKEFKKNDYVLRIYRINRREE
jgi:hypothetical protein